MGENENTTAVEFTDTSTEDYNLDGIDLFGDGDTNQTEDTAATEEAAQEEVPADETATADAKADESFELTFNGEKLTLSREDMVKAAQKGLNYDHVKAKADAAEKNEKAAKLLEQFALSAGVSVEEYIQQASEQLNSREVKALTDQGMSEELAKDYLRLKAENAKSAADKKAAESVQAREKSWNQFADHFGGWDKAPFHDVKDIPEGMKAELEKGTEPLMAWLLYKEKTNNEKAEAEKKAAEVRRRAPSSAKGHGSTVNHDPFLSGLLS